MIKLDKELSLYFYCKHTLNEEAINYSEKAGKLFCFVSQLVSPSDSQFT